MDTITAENTLIDQVRGPVTRPADEGTTAASPAGFQQAYGHRPAITVGATGTADVRVAVRFAAERGWPVAVQATGHGLATALHGGLLIGTGRMSGVRIDPAARTAWVQAGVRWERVIHEAGAYGLAPLSGSSPDVGAVGYTVGGGLGVLGRRYGYAADHVHGVELVTPDGEVRRLTAASEPDLFWAVRGAGANFGVVTALEIGLVPVRGLYGGGLYFDTSAVPAVFEAYREWTGDLPERLTSGVGLIPYPDLPMVPEPLRGRYVAHVRIAFTGSAEDGERLIAPLRAVAPRLVDAVGELPYTASGSIYRDPTVPHGYYGTNAMLRSLDPSSVPALLDAAGPDSPTPCVLQLNHLGGALARQPSAPNSVGHRGATYLVRALSVVDGPGPGAGRDTVDRAAEALEPWTLGRSPNFLFGEAGTARQVRRCYEPDDYRRLARLKDRYDPANRFSANLNIPPRTT